MLSLPAALGVATPDAAGSAASLPPNGRATQTVPLAEADADRLAKTKGAFASIMSEAGGSDTETPAMDGPKHAVGTGFGAQTGADTSPEEAALEATAGTPETIDLTLEQEVFAASQTDHQGDRRKISSLGGDTPKAPIASPKIIAKTVDTEAAMAVADPYRTPQLTSGAERAPGEGDLAAEQTPKQNLAVDPTNTSKKQDTLTVVTGPNGQGAQGERALVLPSQNPDHLVHQGRSETRPLLPRTESAPQGKSVLAGSSEVVSGSRVTDKSVPNPRETAQHSTVDAVTPSFAQDVTPQSQAPSSSIIAKGEPTLQATVARPPDQPQPKGLHAAPQNVLGGHGKPKLPQATDQTLPKTHQVEVAAAVPTPQKDPSIWAAEKTPVSQTDSPQRDRTRPDQILPAKGLGAVSMVQVTAAEAMGMQRGFGAAEPVVQGIALVDTGSDPFTTTPGNSTPAAITAPQPGQSGAASPLQIPAQNAEQALASGREFDQRVARTARHTTELSTSQSATAPQTVAPSVSAVTMAPILQVSDPQTRLNKAAPHGFEREIALNLDAEIGLGGASEGRLTPQAATTISEAPVPQNRADLARAVSAQIAEAARLNPDRAVELTLSPEELGKVKMTVTAGDHGVIVAIVAERGETLDLMRRNIDMLTEDFKALGYTSIGFEFGAENGGGSTGDGGQAGTEDLSMGHAVIEGPSDVTAAQPPPGSRGGGQSGLDLRL